MLTTKQIAAILQKRYPGELSAADAMRMAKIDIDGFDMRERSQYLHNEKSYVEYLEYCEKLSDESGTFEDSDGNTHSMDDQGVYGI